MNLEHFNKLLLESAGVGLAVIDTDDLTVLFSNKRLHEWFPEVDTGVPLDDLIDEIDRDAMRERFAKGRGYTVEATVKAGRRSISLAIHMSLSEAPESAGIVVECQNISKIKELEYMIESYSTMVEKQNRSLQREKERVEKLLLNIMPKRIYEELKHFGVTTPQRYDNASVLMVDFVDFTDMAISRDPAGIITELNDLFTAFDRIAEQFGCERIKTMGDAYMAVSGIPEQTPEHAVNIAKLAILIRRYLRRRNEAHSHEWRCRIGINSGVVIGSIVGVQKYVYDIFGPGVNLAARMEELAEPMQILLCEDMTPLIGDEFNVTELEEVEFKGFGRKRLYQLEAGSAIMPMEPDAFMQRQPV
ncbi:MAG TPA: adenylate/guanylate cyclase domain-containing protein [Afifellaceae bacterium]|nr:adenylate/guanylate cyclase domain-containing protein [Afifellaceae bacterium]